MERARGCRRTQESEEDVREVDKACENIEGVRGWKKECSRRSKSVQVQDR